MPRLLHELAVSRGDGSYARLLARLAKLDLLAIDDWLLAALTDAERRDLLEVIEDRSERASTLIASQLPPPAWHAAIGEPSVADAICDRLVHRAHRLTLKGPTMRDPEAKRGKGQS
jgi:DNA replication protein DnaC